MFIIEHLLKNTKRKVRDWEEAADKWVSEKNNDNFLYSRSREDYKIYHANPLDKIKRILKIIGTVVVFIIIAILAIGFAKEIASRPDAPKKDVKSVVYKNGDVCKKYRVGDTAIVQYGDYEGAEVKIIGGCVDSEPYEVMVTKDQTLFAEGSEKEGFRDQPIKKDLTFKVDSSDNLIVVSNYKEQ